jgi:hypothetical protein
MSWAVSGDILREMNQPPDDTFQSSKATADLALLCFATSIELLLLVPKHYRNSRQHIF